MPVRAREAVKVQSRPAGAWERSQRRGPLRRLTLRRADGQVYLDRWGLISDRVGGVLLHRMEAPDPGLDLHDHPWPFVSIILWGGYTEYRCDVREAVERAQRAEAVEREVVEIGQLYRERNRLAADAPLQVHIPDGARRGRLVRRRWLSARRMGLHECHTISALSRRTSWSLVIRGRRRPKLDPDHNVWGFFHPSGYMPEDVYDATVRADRRDLWSDQRVAQRPWSLDE